jgi:hypothetical protein
VNSQLVAKEYFNSTEVSVDMLTQYLQHKRRISDVRRFKSAYIHLETDGLEGVMEF